MSNNHIHQLVALITSAAKTIEDEFAKSPEPIIPTLDDVKPHPLDGSPGDAIRQAVAILDGACAQLCASVAPPSHTIVNVSIDIPFCRCPAFTDVELARARRHGSRLSGRCYQ